MSEESSIVVDDYVVDQERNENIMRSAQVIEHGQHAREQQVNAQGRYPCRSPSCSKTFAHDGKLRRDHELKHNPPVVIDEPPTDIFVIDSKFTEDNKDDMLSYQKALLDYCMLVLNFWDAIAEGDGERTSVLEVLSNVPQASRGLCYKVLIGCIVPYIPGLCLIKPTGSPSFDLEQRSKDKDFKC